MKNLPWQAFCSLCMLLVLAACSDLDFISEEDYLKNEYAVNWIKRFGIIDEGHDWSMARPVAAHVEPGSFRLGGKVEIYTDQPSNGGALIAVVTETKDITIDVSKNATSVYVRAYTADGTLFGHERFAIVDGKANVVHTTSRADEGEPALYPAPAPQSRAGEESPLTYRFLLACEDLGSLYDTDFNDVVVGINYVEGDDKFTVTALAAGGLYGTNLIYTHADGTDEEIFETHEALGASGYENGSYPLLNTRAYYGPGATHTVHLHSGETFSMSADRERFSIVALRSADDDINTGIHIYAKTEDNPAPQILCLDGTWEWPAEQVSIIDAYPGFSAWTSDKDASTWAGSPVAENVVRRTYPTEPDIPDIPDVPDYNPVTGMISKTITVTATSQQRRYKLYVPENVQANAPLVVSLHGAGGKVFEDLLGERQNIELAPFSTESADAHGWIVAYPQGNNQNFGPFGTVPGWNATGTSNEDIAFLRALVADVSSEYSIDSDRVYCCGFSNGGMMTYAATSAASDLFAAFASISGFQMNEFHYRGTGERPVPFLHIHGRSDTFVHVDFQHIVRSNFLNRNGNVITPTTSSAGNYTKYVYAAGEGGFPYEYYEVTGMDHQSYVSLNGTSSSEVMWEFLNRYKLSDDCDHTLKWRCNPDPDIIGIGGDYGWQFTSVSELPHGWTMGLGRCMYYGNGTFSDESVRSSGATSKTPVEANVYRSLQFEPGYYYLRLTSDGRTRHDNARIKIQKRATGGEKVVNVKLSASGEVIAPFQISEYGEYFIAVDKGTGDGFSITQLEIHSSNSLRSAQNCTEITDDLYPGETAFETVDKYVDFTTMSSYNMWSAGCTVGISDGCLNYSPLYEANAETGVNELKWGQFFCADNISTTVGTNYTVTFKVKGSKAHSFNAVFRTSDWSQSVIKTLNVTTEWTEQTLTFENIPGTNCFVLLQPGAFDGTISLQCVKVTH